MSFIGQAVSRSITNLGGNVVGEVVDVTDNPRSCDIDETPPVAEEPLCPERQRQQTMSQKIMDELNREVFNSPVSHLNLGYNFPQLLNTQKCVETLRKMYSRFHPF